jgi:hypothetical protein
MSNMRHDTRIRRLINKFGLKGYGLYCFILESVTEGLETDSPLPELEEMSSDIAELFHEDTLKIEEMILFCMNQGLFEQSEMTGKIMCHKIYKFIEQSSTRSKEIRGMISEYKNYHTKPLPSPTVSDNLDKYEEKNITEEKRTEIEKNINTEKPPKKKKPPKHKYGEYKNVLLTDDELQKLKDKFGEDETVKWIKKLDEGIEMKGYTYKSCYLAIRKWSEKEAPKKVDPKDIDYGKGWET